MVIMMAVTPLNSDASCFHPSDIVFQIQSMDPFIGIRMYPTYLGRQRDGVHTIHTYYLNRERAYVEHGDR